MLTDKIGIIQEPFKQEVTVKYAYDALYLLKDFGGDFLYRQVLEEISRKHLSRIPISILEDKLYSKAGYISGLLYLIICENTREALSIKPDEFYYLIGKMSIINQNQWAVSVARLFPIKRILREITKRTPNFTTLIDLKLEKVEKEGNVGKAIINRKTKQEYIETLKKYFNDDELKYILKNDCRLTKGVLLTIPDMFKGYKAIEIKETQCEVDSDFCRYELRYGIPNLGERILYYIKNNPLFKYYNAKKELEKLKQIYEIRRKELRKASSKLELLVDQLAETTEELDNYITAQDVSKEYRNELEKIIQESRQLIKERKIINPLYTFLDDNQYKIFFTKYQKILHSISLLQYLIGVSEKDIEIYNNDLIKFVEKLTKLKETLFNILAEAHLRGELNHALLYLINIIEKKDTYTRGHSERVKDISLEIAKKLSLSEEEIKKLSFESLLHDVGKIATPSRILRKKAKLNDFEMQIIQQHAFDTYNIVKRIEIDNADEIALNAAGHHLRIDGTGYPKEIGSFPTLDSRIIAIADALDAMNSRRVYRDKRDKEYIIKELEENSGKQFDPEITKIVLNLIKRDSNFLKI